MTQTNEIIVIGGGSAGCAAAQRAGQLGMNVVLVEQAELGGADLAYGTQPMLSLFRAVDVYEQVRQAASYGVLTKSVDFNLKKMVERSVQIVAQKKEEIRNELRDYKVQILGGHAKIVGTGRVEIATDGRSVNEVIAKHIVIATGARARMLPCAELDGKLVYSPAQALSFPTLPRNLMIIGAGKRGMEWMSFYHSLGVNVTVLECCDRILGSADEDVASFYREVYEKKGVRFITGANIKRVDKNGKGVQVTIEQGVRATLSSYDRVMIAVGREANTFDTGLEKTRVRMDKGAIQTNVWGATDEPFVYAIGSAASEPKPFYQARQEGVACVDKLAGRMDALSVDIKNITHVIHGQTEVAWFGLSEAVAKAEGYRVRVGRSSFLERVRLDGSSEGNGFVKTVFDDKTGALLGAHMVGPNVTEAISTLSLARTLETTEREIMQTLFSYPSMAEALQKSVRKAFVK